METSFYLLFWW